MMFIKKHIAGLLTAASVLGLANAASAAGSVNASAPVTVAIGLAVSLTKTTNMAFGTITKPANASVNTVVLDTANGVTLTGAGNGSVVIGSTKTSAVFALLAPAGTTYTVTPTLTMSGLTNVAANPIYAVNTGVPDLVPAGGAQNLSFGGSFDIDTSTLAQAYTGTLALTLNYN